jgi:hypothetical protein
MDVEMRHCVAEHERVHVFSTERILLDAGDAAHQATDRLRFVDPEIAECRDMALWFEHQPSSIRGRTSQRVDVSDVREFIRVDHTALDVVALGVLVADRTVSA